MQELRDNFRVVREFLRKPSLARLFFAIIAVILVLGVLGQALTGITHRNVYGALIRAIGHLFSLIGGSIARIHQSGTLWIIVSLITALVVELIVVGLFGALYHRSIEREARLASDLKQSQEKEEVLRADSENYKREADAAKKSDSVSRETLTQLSKMTLTLQTTAEDMLAEANVWEQVSGKFLFTPYQVADAFKINHSLQGQLTAIRDRFNTGRSALEQHEPIADVVTVLLQGDQQLATRVVKLIRRSIDQQPGPNPESVSPNHIERKLRERIREAVDCFEQSLGWSDPNNGAGDALINFFAMLRGREEAAKKLTGQEQPIEALNGLLDFAIDFTRNVFNADRGFIFVPDATEQMLFRCAATHLNVIERAHPSTFYVGDSAARENDRGVAGNAYIHREPICCHWNSETGKFEDKYDAAEKYALRPSFHVRYTRLHPPEYHSFIAIPLYRPLLRKAESETDEGDTQVEGVLCLDARAPNHFRDHFLLDTEAGYQQPPATLIGVIYELVQWRSGVRLQGV